ncbi:glycerol-3-phosphate 1-O-acyltransferase PlsY [Effusibacillus lacus]|uniref:Glycerol-3-phosphate acyltransferase n=1 Tax=Effusibacillus lacus TaxID=1348429 RepID=A0A292YIH6_9BACL|nr:glycerol-3-phosphate 1-O-acyltransferase PlsY [Effusibacillus lacus]TCS75270.1 glycerol-3-phosphate acyltransferase PlsY [Effusibacillus lacus]GAX89708.1 acyl-phosphate glycerol 3-phosphate acyltransferase [Effusibacillus lacus]
MPYIFSAVIGYLLGSISFSYLVGRYKAGIDIREHGSGNAGATNTLRVLGKQSALIVFLADALKGVMSVAAGYLLTGTDAGMAIGGLFSIIGHNWPLFFNFRGGKGVATTIGVVVSVVFLPGIIAGIIAIILLVISRIVSLASLIFLTILPIAVLLTGQPLVYFWMSLAMAVMAYWRHRTNIVRLIQGKENRLGRK